jgi:FSR family fosmidomycin resistance protein-like MFS transporter
MNKTYITLIYLWLSHFLVDFMIGIWPIYKTIAGLDIAVMGLIAGVSVFIGEVFQLYFGQLSDRGFRKKLIIAGLCLSSMCGLISYTENYFLLFILFQMTCLGSGAFHPSAVGLVGSLSKNHKGVFITLFIMGGAIGFALSQILFKFFYSHFDGNTAFLMIPSAIIAFSIALYPLTESNSKTSKKPITLKSILALFKTKHMSCLYFTQICNQIIGWAVIFLLPDILLSRGFDSWISFGGGHLSFVLGGAFIMVPAGLIADKFSYKTVIITALTSGSIFFYTFLKFPFISNSTLLILLFLMGASIMVINPLVIAFGNKLYPKEPGRVSGFLMGFSWCIANPIGQAGGGLLTKLFTEDAGAKALSILGIFFLIGLAISVLLPAKDSFEFETANT